MDAYKTESSNYVSTSESIRGCMSGEPMGPLGRRRQNALSSRPRWTTAVLSAGTRRVRLFPCCRENALLNVDTHCDHTPSVRVRGGIVYAPSAPGASGVTIAACARISQSLARDTSVVYTVVQARAPGARSMCIVTGRKTTLLFFVARWGSFR